MNQSVLHKKEFATMQDFAADRESILRTLAYFDIFNYPLTREEIKQFLVTDTTSDGIDSVVDALVREGILFRLQEFFSLQNNLLLLHRRREGNQRAEYLLKKANGIGKFLFQFPFVKGIAISGSLSKNFADEKADIDFFIITQSNRLWLARTLMHLYKKLTYLTGRDHYYCMNYYLDGEALHLKEQDIYTAIEVKTLLPIAGGESIRQFFQGNDWTSQWLPHCSFRKLSHADASPSIIKKFMEWMLDNRFGNWLDNKLQSITTRRWRKKAMKGKINSHGLVLELIAEKHFAYSNSGSFREKVINKYNSKLRELGLTES